MFEDMGHTSGVRRIGLETDEESIVDVISCQVQIVGTRLVMCEV